MSQCRHRDSQVSPTPGMLWGAGSPLPQRFLGQLLTGVCCAFCPVLTLNTPAQGRRGLRESPGTLGMKGAESLRLVPKTPSSDTNKMHKKGVCGGEGILTQSIPHTVPPVLLSKPHKNQNQIARLRRF